MKTLICIAVYNEEKTIAKTIRSVINSYPDKDNMRLFIISSGSTDNTNNIISHFIDQGYPITLCEEPERKGKASALNMFLQNANLERPDLCIFTDGDVLLDPYSITFLKSRFIKDPSLDAICGNPVAVVSSKNSFWELVAVENCIIWDLTRRILAIKNKVWPLTGYLFAAKPPVLPSNLPIELAADDAFIGWYIMQNGGKIGYEPYATVRVHFPMNLRDYYLQKTRTRHGWKQMEKYASRDYGDLQRIRQSVFWSRVKSGNKISLICWLLDKAMWLGALSSLHQRNRHLWAQVPSTKI